MIAAPTVVGSIYGMNFDHMPELHWTLGYPMALALMALSSLVVLRHQQARRLALTARRSSGGSDAGREQAEDEQPEHDPVGHERRVGVVGDVPQQPGDRRVRRRRS